jgi:hypothetical protein
VPPFCRKPRRGFPSPPTEACVSTTLRR